MKRLIAVLLICLFCFTGITAEAGLGDGLRKAAGSSGGTWTPGNVNTPVKSDSVKKDISDLKALYNEFQKFWHVKDKDDLQDRFEEFLKSKNIYTKEIEDYDDFMEIWVDNYDEDLDFDDLYDIYELEFYVADDPDPDNYDILLDEDIDDLYDDYLDDYIDEEYFDEYGEYFDEVYYD